MSQYTGNSMIDGDTGDSPSSPYYIEKGTCKCELCGQMAESVEEVEYALPTDAEEEPSRFIDVCEDCLWSMREDKKYILI